MCSKFKFCPGTLKKSNENEKGFVMRIAQLYLKPILTLVLLRGVGNPPNGFRPGAQNRTAKG